MATRKVQPVESPTDGTLSDRGPGWHLGSLQDAFGDPEATTGGFRSVRAWIRHPKTVRDPKVDAPPK